MQTPAEQGYRTPGDATPPERCVIGWPSLRDPGGWAGHVGAARDAVAIIARAVNEHEPVFVVADVGEGRAAEQWLAQEVEVVELDLPVGHRWLRDAGPLPLVHPDGRRLALAPDADGPAVVLADQLGLPTAIAPVALTGGAVLGDGAGTLLASAAGLLPADEQREERREELDRLLPAWLGVDRVVWIEHDLRDDPAVPGHLDKVVAFVGPGRVVVQTTADRTDPDHATTRAVAADLAAAGLEVEIIDVLPHVEVFDRLVEVPYVDLYASASAVFVPLAGAAADKAVLRQLERSCPGRDVVGVPGRVLAYGGGGLHRLTRPIPAGREA